MALRAKKFSIQVPTVSDTASVFKVIEKGYSDASQADRDLLLAGFNTSQVFPVVIPGTGLSLNMLKTQVSFDVAGQGWISYQIDWQEPVSTNQAIGAGVVETVRDQIGATPATATVSLTGSTIPDPVYNLGVEIDVVHQGSLIFRGYCTDIDFSSSTGQTGTCLMTAQDVRWLMSRTSIGQTDVSSGFKADDLTDVIFNEGGFPDKDSLELAFNKGSSIAATMWTYGTAIQAILTWYNFDGLFQFDASMFSTGSGALPHKDKIMPETNLSGQNLLNALDQLILAGEEVSWKVNFADNPPKISIVKLGAPNSSHRILQYRTEAIEPDHATQANVRESIAGSFKTAEVQTEKIVVESYYHSGLWNKSIPNSSRFALLFTLAGSAAWNVIKNFQGNGLSPANFDPTGREFDSIPCKFARQLVTRVKSFDPDSGHRYDANEITDEVLVDASPENPMIYCTIDNGSTYFLVTGGIEIDYEFGRIFLGQKNISANGTSFIEPTVDGPGGFVNKITDTSQVFLTANIATILDLRQIKKVLYAGFDMPFHTTRSIKEERIAAEYRYKIRLYDLTQPKAPPGPETASTRELYVDPTTKLANYSDQMVKQASGIMFTGNVTAPFAPLVFPGDTLTVENFSRWPNGETMFVTTFVLTQQRGKFTLNLSTSNQFWQPQQQLATNPAAIWKKAQKIIDRIQYGYP